MHPIDEQYNKLGYKNILNRVIGRAWEEIKKSKGYETEEEKKAAFQTLLTLTVAIVAQFKPVLTKDNANGN